MYQALGETECKSEIASIFNKYKDTFHDLIDNSDTEFSDWLKFLSLPGAIDKKICNMPESRNSSPKISRSCHFSQ